MCQPVELSSLEHGAKNALSTALESATPKKLPYTAHVPDFEGGGGYTAAGCEPAA